MENENTKLVYDNSPVEETPKKKMPKAAKVPLIIVGSLVGFIVLVWGGLSVLKYPIYADFYSKKKDICAIPGLNSGTTPQGVTYDEVNDAIYTSSYSKKGSVVYTVKDKKSFSHELIRDGAPHTGHVGGIATSGTNAYIADGSKVYTIPTSSLLTDNNEKVDMGTGIDVHCAASFVFTDDTYLYVGEFHDGKHYFTDNVYGDNHAIVEKYLLSTFAEGAVPAAIISVRNKVQGFCVTPNGTHVLSTSYGLASSHLYIYNADTLVDTGDTMYGAPVFTYSKCSKDLLCPPMTEDLDIYKDGRVITLTESACNKYVFGKFFFANNIFSLNIK